ncbi:transferrin-like [Colias croceus]|uniref:transferrin-like n=1 Tax=Colias crocea TaxID=72248 RepID=UPI001E27BFEA|nr:transferrin-like [Colias croceus]
MESLKILILCSFVKFVLLQGVGSGSNGNLRLCIVEGKGAYKRGAKFCPVLDEDNSGIECVLGTDRLDCLRRISKGTVDFGSFSPEDLIAAQWADIDVLVTHELRHRDRDYERTVVAVVNRKILPDHPWSLDAVLRNTTLCHPGNGVNDLRPLSDTLSGYLESLVITRSCDPQLSLTENRLKAVAGFFGKACKAGYWVPDVVRDAELKRKYPSLCAACESSCDSTDRYWGVSGALSCLLDGAGDVMWGELDDVTAYFGLNTNSSMYPKSDNFAYLCRDGTWQSLKDNHNPCVWLNRPWPVIVAKRKAAAAVTKALQAISNNLYDNRWHTALSALLEAREPPRPEHKAPLDYLAAAEGFREAYSQSGCRPPRHVTLCTTSLLEQNKCSWLSEAGAVYGVTPPLQCAVRSGERAALRAVRQRDCDVARVGGDWLRSAVREFDLSPILYEVTPIVEKMNTVVAYVKKGANINKMADLRGKRAAFPRYDGFAWQAVMDYLSKKQHCDDILNNYFSEICAPGLEKYNFSESIVNRFTKSCYQNGGDEERAALMSLVDGHSDVAFISMNAFNLFKAEQISSGTSKINDIVPLCPEDNAKYCYISWANIGHLYVPKNISDVRRHEIKNVFTKLDQLFGKHQPFHSPMFSLYGPFNHQLDVLFHNNTKSLASEEIFGTHPYDTMPFNFERRILNDTFDSCQITEQMNSARKLTSGLFLIVPALVVFVLGRS